MSSFFAFPVGEMSKSKMSIGRPSVVHALGICPYISSEPMGRRTETAKTHIDKTSNVALDRSAAQEQIDLIVAVACFRTVSTLRQEKSERGDLPKRLRYSMTRKVV